MRDVVERRKITPPQYAAQLGVGIAKVVGWIESGELRAFNAATRPTMRPRWLIDLDDVADFERRRAAVPPAPAPKRRRSSVAPAVEYF